MKPKKRFRMTRQRRVILEELQKLHSHPTADEVYETVRKRMPRISLGTVYRNLEVLSRSGLALRLDLGGTRRRFDGTTSDHYHVRCVRCGKVADLSAEPIPGLEAAVRGDSDFEIIGHRLDFLGLCPNCRGKGADPHVPPMKKVIANGEQA